MCLLWPPYVIGAVIFLSCGFFLLEEITVPNSTIWGDGRGEHWLVRIEWRPPGWSVCLPLLIFPCTIKFRSSLLAPAHPSGPGKRAVKWMCVCVCFFLLSFFFSSPDLSRCRLDVYHTSTRGVALVRIWNTGLKRTARGSLEMQDTKKSPKIRHLGTITQLCRAISLHLRHMSTIGNKLVKKQYLPHMSYNMANFGLLAAEICWRV